MTGKSGKKVRAPSTHAQIMESLGFEAPSRPVKKPKGTWGLSCQNVSMPTENAAYDVSKSYQTPFQERLWYAD